MVLREEGVTAVLDIRVGYEGEGDVAPAEEEIPRERGRPKTQEAGLKSNMAAGTI